MRRSIIAVLVLAGCTEENPFQADTSGSDGTSGGPSSGGDPTSAGTSMTTSASSTVGDDETSAGPTTDGPSDTTMVDPTDPDTGEPTCAHSCVALPPGDWEGPVAVLHDAPDDPMPDCEGAFDEAAITAFANLDAPAASCACDCEAPTGLSCSSVTVVSDNTAGCGSPSGSWVVTASCNNSPSGTDLYWQATAEVDDGECEPIETFGVPDAGFGDRYSACGQSSLDTTGCEAGTACIETPTAPYDGRLCIWHSGDLQCPADAGYDVRTVYYGDYADDRGCEACTCGDAQGDCDGSVGLWSSDGCSGAIVAQLTISGTCSMVDGLISAARIGTAAAPADDASCPASDSQAIGEAEGTDAITFCCDA